MNYQKIFSSIVVKIFLAAVLLAMIVVGGLITRQQKTPSSEVVQPTDRETENYYDVLGHSEKHHS